MWNRGVCMKKICLIMILMMVLTSCAKKEEEVIESVDVKQTIEENKKQEVSFVSHIDVDKQETVYAQADAYGNIYSEEVEVILRSNDEEYIKDISDLEDIRNTFGDEKLVIEGNNLSFKNKNEDIHYKGNSSKDLPVSVKITYYLDGRQMDIEELRGKSGRLKMRFDYKNNTSLTQDGFNLIEPYIAISIVNIDQDIFSNVSIKNGKLLEYGENKIGLIYCLPGLKNSLRLSQSEVTKDIKLEEYGEIEADVNNFDLDYTATILSKGLFEDIEDKDLNELSDMTSDTDSFQDDIDELKDNTSKLYDGTLALKEGLDAYTGALQEYDKQMGSIVEASKSIAGAMEDVSELNGEIRTNVENINSWLSNYQNILLKVNEMKQYISEISDENLRQQLISDTDYLNEQLSYLNVNDYQLLMENLGKLTVYIDGLDTGDENTSIKGLKESTRTLSTYLESAKKASEQLIVAICNINGGVKKLVEGAKEFDEGVKDFADNGLDDLTKYSGSSTKDIINRIKAIKKIDEAQSSFTGHIEGKTVKTSYIIETDGID